MSTIELEPLTPTIGSIVQGVDLGDPDDVGRHSAQLKRAFLDRQVIFFRDQKLTPDAQVSFARAFGELRPVSSSFPSHPQNPNLEILQSKGRQTATDIWHSDMTWQTEPPIATCLYAINVPPSGGDTLWASMTAAYDSLDTKFKSYIEGLSAIHDWEGPEIVARVKSSPESQKRYEEMRLQYPPIEQPVVKVHPETGRKAIYVNTMYTTRIVGVTRAESASLCTFLSGLSEVPEWQVRFKWAPGSLAIWDNRSVQHYAVNDYYPFPRLMHRVTIY